MTTADLQELLDEIAANVGDFPAVSHKSVYYREDGTPATLREMLEHEPAWALSRWAVMDDLLRQCKNAIEALQAENARLKEDNAELSDINKTVLDGAKILQSELSAMRAERRGALCGGCDGDGYRMVIDPDEHMAVRQTCGRCKGSGIVPIGDGCSVDACPDCALKARLEAP